MALAAEKIMRQGTEIIVIALDDYGDDECYEDLRSIYPNVVACDDLNKLTGKPQRILFSLNGYDDYVKKNASDTILVGGKMMYQE